MSSRPLPNLHLVEVPAAEEPRIKRDASRYLRWYMPLDALALGLGFLCAWGLAAAINAVFFERPGLTIMSEYGTVQVVEYVLIAAGTLVWFQHGDHYRMRRPFWLEVKNIVQALGFAMMGDGFLQFAAKQDFSRLWLMSGWLIAALLMIGLRNGLRGRLRRMGLFEVPTLLIGNGETAQQTCEALTSEPCLGYAIVARIKELPAAFLQAGKSWETLCEKHGADYIVVALDGQEMAGAEQPLAQLVREGLPFSISPPLAHLPVMGMVPHYFFNHDVMLLARSSGLEQPVPRLLKRMLDVIVSGVALLALCPLMLLLALLVKCDGGPAFFGHSRIGRNGKTFPCLKFRSMAVDGDLLLERHLAENPDARKEWLASRKLKDDPRITRIGGFLRRSSLDELPQLLNVLYGDMSLVGPRPIVTAEVANYDGDIAHYYRVRPGVTGLWQVSGRSDVSYPQRVHMDSWYVRNWSLWHDIAILCKTFPALMKRSGAY